jgi:hypothetical protein
MIVQKLTDPEFGDKMVLYTCIFGLGFVVGMLCFGG